MISDGFANGPHSRQGVRHLALGLLAAVALLAAACSSADSSADSGGEEADSAAGAAPITLYTGRNTNLVGPLIDARAFEQMQLALQAAREQGAIVSGGERVLAARFPGIVVDGRGCEAVSYPAFYADLARIIG